MVQEKKDNHPPGNSACPGCFENCHAAVPPGIYQQETRQFLA